VINAWSTDLDGFWY